LLQEEILKALVLGGTNADEGTWPWMMALFKKTSDGLRYQCGGAVIRRQYLLTAAHCFDEDRNEENYNIRVGGYDVSKPVQGDVPGAEEVQMEELIIHPKYERRRFNNDIALIKLSKPIKRTDQQICLPTGQIQTRGGQNAQLTGWGLTVEGAGQEGDHSALLQQVSLPIQDTDDCRDTYVDRLKNTFGSNFPEGIDDSKFICAGDQHAKKDACRGDSGGPLMIKDSDGKFFAVGVVSVGGSLCGKNLPTLFTKVETYSEWISQIVNR
jgi:secreted trypsin-like serine protease